MRQCLLLLSFFRGPGLVDWKRYTNEKLQIVLFGRQKWDLSQEARSWDNTGGCSEDVGEETGYIGVFATKLGSLKAKRLLLTKEKAHTQS